MLSEFKVWIRKKFNSRYSHDNAEIYTPKPINRLLKNVKAFYFAYNLDKGGICHHD